MDIMRSTFKDSYKLTKKDKTTPWKAVIYTGDPTKCCSLQVTLEKGKMYKSICRTSFWLSSICRKIYISFPMTFVLMYPQRRNTPESQGKDLACWNPCDFHGIQRSCRLRTFISFLSELPSYLRHRIRSSISFMQVVLNQKLRKKRLKTKP